MTKGGSMKSLPKWITEVEKTQQPGNFGEKLQINRLQKALRIAWKALNFHEKNWRICALGLETKQAMSKIERLGAMSSPKEKE